MKISFLVSEIFLQDCGKIPTYKENKGWYGYDGSKYCYKFDFTPKLDQITWEAAHQSCRDHNAEMVSFHKFDEEQNLIKLMISKLSKDEPYFWFWMGLIDEGPQGYHWTDSSPLDYVNWGKGIVFNFV